MVSATSSVHSSDQRLSLTFVDHQISVRFYMIYTQSNNVCFVSSPADFVCILQKWMTRWESILTSSSLHNFTNQKMQTFEQIEFGGRIGKKNLKKFLCWKTLSCFLLLPQYIPQNLIICMFLKHAPKRWNDSVLSQSLLETWDNRKMHQSQLLEKQLITEQNLVLWDNVQAVDLIAR